MLKAQMPETSVERVNGYPTPQMLTSAADGAENFLIFLDAVSNFDQAIELLQEVGRRSQQFQFIALLANNNPEAILRCLRAGAADFLVQPFSEDQLTAALSKMARMQPGGENGHKGNCKIISVMPAKGACGATTIASNLAQQAKKQGVPRVLLIDLDALAGNVSFLLKTKSIYSFLDAMQRAHELDNDLWKAMVNPVHGVDVLLSPDIMPSGAHDLRDASPIIDFARRNYDLIILDTSSVYGDWNLSVARRADDLLLVTTNELPALQAAQRALSYLETNRIGNWKIRLIVNRYLLDVGLSRDVIGTALHADVFETLPSDYEAVQKALMDGKSIPVSSAFGKSIASLAARLSGHKEPQKPVTAPKKTSSLSPISGLLSLFSRTSPKVAK